MQLIPVMSKQNFCSITPVFGVNYYIQICWYGAHKTFLININVENSHAA